MKTNASILMTFDPGNSIEDAFHDAVEVASKIGCVIEFKFNEVSCLAYPHSNPYNGIAEYFKVVKEKCSYKIAQS